MPTITQRGRELAETYEKFCGAEYGLADREICSLIARKAVSLHRVYEAVCNGHPACSSPTLPIETVNRLQTQHEAWCAKREATLESQITKLAEQLPGISSVRFCGDPRGVPVRLVTLNGRGDSWDEPKSICVP